MRNNLQRYGSRVHGFDARFAQVEEVFQHLLGEHVVGDRRVGGGIMFIDRGREKVLLQCYQRDRKWHDRCWLRKVVALRTERR